MSKKRWELLPMNRQLAGMISNRYLPNGTKQYMKGLLRVLWSPQESHADGLYKHASVSHPNRYPTWDEILDVRYTFFGDKDMVYQVLPPKTEYVNVSKNCFHLWAAYGTSPVPQAVPFSLGCAGDS